MLTNLKSPTVHDLKDKITTFIK